MNRKMRAWQVEKYGGLEQLQLQEVHRPALRPGHALVRVAHAGLNFADVMSVQGRYQTRQVPPFILGAEISGTIVESADDCEYAPGVSVMAQIPSGGYADYCLVDARRLISLDPAVDLADAAAIPVSFTTAAVGLFRVGSLQAGHTILIHAAAGAVGLAAVKLARDIGATVIAGASSSDKRALAVAAGAHFAIDNRAPDWARSVMEIAPQGVNVIFDPVGGETTLQSIATLAWRGRILIVGFANGKPAAIPANQLLVRAASACGVFWSFDQEADAIRAIQENLAVALADGRIRPHIGRHVGFAELKNGLEALTAGKTTGKLVLDVQKG